MFPSSKDSTSSETRLRLRRSPSQQNNLWKARLLLRYFHFFCNHLFVFFCFESCYLNHTREVPSICELQDDVQLVVLNERRVVLDHIGVVQLLLEREEKNQTSSRYCHETSLKIDRKSRNRNQSSLNSEHTVNGTNKNIDVRSLNLQRCPEGFGWKVPALKRKRSEVSLFPKAIRLFNRRNKTEFSRQFLCKIKTMFLKVCVLSVLSL